jgi:hypothetical protein
VARESLLISTEGGDTGSDSAPVDAGVGCVKSIRKDGVPESDEEEMTLCAGGDREEAAAATAFKSATPDDEDGRSVDGRGVCSRRGGRATSLFSAERRIGSRPGGSPPELFLASTVGKGSGEEIDSPGTRVVRRPADATVLAAATPGGVALVGVAADEKDALRCHSGSSPPDSAPLPPDREEPALPLLLLPRRASAGAADGN